MTEYFPVTKEELNMIKNDCLHPETNSCDGCELADPLIGCKWKGANILMDEVIRRNPVLIGNDNGVGILFESEDGWKIIRAYSGMGEFKYHLFFREELYCQAPSKEILNNIIGAIRFSSNMRNAEKHEKMIRDDEHKKTMDEFGILHGEDATRFEEYINSPPEPLTETQKEFFRQAMKLSKVI